MNQPQIGSVLIEKSEWDILTKLIYIAMILLIISVIFCVGAIRKYFKMKIIDTESLIQDRSVPEKESFSVRVSAGFEFLSLLLVLIKSEIDQHLFTFQTLHKEYPITTLEDDIKLISQRVYDSLAPTLLSDPSIPFQAEYIMGLITRLTSSSLIEQVRQYNQSLRYASNTEEQDNRPTPPFITLQQSLLFLFSLLTEKIRFRSPRCADGLHG